MSKRTVLVASELGRASVRLRRLRPVIDALTEAGYRVVLASADVSAAQAVLPDTTIVQAPVPDHDRTDADEPGCFADLLLAAGFGEGFTDMLSAWHWLAAAIRPERFLLSFAPGALVAYQAQAAAITLLEDGYSCPPDVDDLPPLRYWQPAFRSQFRGSTRAVLASINAGLVATGQVPITRLAELYARCAAVFIDAVPSLDPGGSKDYGQYLGCGWSGATGTPEHIAGLTLEVPGIDQAERWRQALRESGAWATDAPEVAVTTDPDTACRALGQGRAVCFIPLTGADRVLAERLGETGAVQVVPGRAGRAPLRDVLAAIQRLRGSGVATRQAAAFAREQLVYDSSQAVDRVVDSVIGNQNPV